MPLTLYDHATHTPARYKSRLLSRDGNRANAKLVPKSLTNVLEFGSIISRPHGEPVTTLVCEIAIWKLRELGWLTSEDKRQENLDLAHGKTASMQGGSSA